MLNHQRPEQVFRALADPTRLAILEALWKGENSVGELAKPLAISLAAVVQQINILEESGLISTRKSGRTRTCRIEPAGFAIAEQWLSQRRLMWERQFDQLGALLDEDTSNSSTPKGTS